MSDFLVRDEGSIYLLTPKTPAAVEWVRANLPEDRLRWAGATVIEHRYVGDVITGIAESGLQVEIK
jgi:hypothetical protein